MEVAEPARGLSLRFGFQHGSLHQQFAEAERGVEMRYKSLLVGAVLAAMAAFLPLFSSSASASVPRPTISAFSPRQGPVGTTVTITGTNLDNATSVSFGQTQAAVVVDKFTEVKVLVPTGATTSVINVTTPGGLATRARKFVVTAPLDGVVSVASAANSNCAVLTSGGVDCWGDGEGGELGNGVFYTSAHHFGSAFAVPVLGVGASGTLGGVASVASDASGYCALLTSGGVDCWGDGDRGQLGDGRSYTTGHEGSAVPVAVLGVGGSGTLGGVVSLTSDENYRGVGYCALLTSGGVDCWGGQDGDGSSVGSAVPVAVLGAGGSGTLGGVVSLTSDGSGYCALLSSGGVDCWGGGYLGNGIAEESHVPVAVLGVGGNGTLGGVASLATDGAGYCALLTASGLDCWGDGYWGQLGNGVFYGVDQGEESTVPVAVLGLGGRGTLGGVASLAGGYCSVLTSGGVDCWGFGYWGQLGNGVFYGSIDPIDAGSAVPVAVLGLGGSGTLGGATSLATDDQPYGQGDCALLTSGGVDCWGYGRNGELGDGVKYRTGNPGDAVDGSAVPVAVLGVGGSGILAGVVSLVGDTQGFCTLPASGGVDCWGVGYRGQLGDGVFLGSAVPVAVATAINESVS